MVGGVVAAGTGASGPAVFIVGKAFTVEFQTLRLATVAWLMLPICAYGFLLLVLWLHGLGLTALLGGLYVFLQGRALDFFENLLSQDGLIQRGGVLALLGQNAWCEPGFKCCLLLAHSRRVLPDQRQVMPLQGLGDLEVPLHLPWLLVAVSERAERPIARRGQFLIEGRRLIWLV